MADVMLTPYQLISSAVSSSQNSSGTGTGTGYAFKSSVIAAAIQLKVTTAPSTSGTSTLDVYVQHCIDSSTVAASSCTYDDFIHFNQVAVASANGVGSQIVQWSAMAAAASSVNLHTPATFSLGAGTVRQGPTGNTWRVGYTVANSPVAASSSAWVFQVIVQPFHA